MANTPSARKRARQSDKRRRHNATLRSMSRTAIKKVVNAIDAGDVTVAKAAYDAAVPAIDKMVSKRILNKNKAARHKSRLHAHIRKLAAAATA